ncbi:TPA: hypothetical protein H1011_01810 [archaeon]|jgi:hypothetical protein|uniref:Uncharacterized protein n=1 Tax=Candidatus Undinarchaeum marinum TaxID=2756141 RepID=A0A832XFV8_9ARCH|nr:hypothetical protein [Candidatus Undinarchaeum marinum]
MTEKEIINYVKEQLAAGHSPDEVRKALDETGWKSIEVEAAISKALPKKVRPQTAETNEDVKKAKTNRIVFISGIVLGVILLIVLVTLVAKSGVWKGVELQECGSDEACLKSALMSCSPATGLTSKGAGDSMAVSYTEVKGMKGDKCKVFVRIEDAGSVLGITVKGRSMDCEIPTSLLKETGTISVSNVDKIKDYCEGTLVEFAEQVVNTVQPQ